jgi:hypothetical protein
VFAHAEEAANAQDDILDLSCLFQDDIVDVAYLLIGVVVNVDADELGCPPFTFLVRRGWRRDVAMKFSGRFKSRFEANVGIGGSVSELGGFATSRLNNRATLIVIGQI